MFRAFLRLIRFDKPIGSLLLLWPTLWALWVAYQGVPPLDILLTFCLGVFLTRSAGCAINDLADSEFDGRVKRTSSRPLVTGEITKIQAALITVLLSLLAFIIAFLYLKHQTVLWTIPALVIFVTYPLFKRFFPVPQMYLALAFSFGIPMAFIEASGSTNLVCWLLFVANFCWVLAYDTIYALVDIDDDLKIGIKTSAITFGEQVILVIMLCYLFFIIFTVLVGFTANLKSIFWLGLVLECGLIYHVYSLIKNRDRELCFRAFLFNNNIGGLLFVSILASFYHW